ncbi:16S rRNA (adenine(1518)-N(6)/adenine(1519)-N(6))-dimethyltransferase RsmA [Dehalococcoides mccartyi]|jgi:16S rRNA (adenine1518-N6/adenine1519-N6)-dimethyltransferase|uniref:16S rRNA (adenine(1518)-N(6)/adenine(1519)-N(6))- dimethyltransferase RsmA n=1 Tax=Dehalococcoides mccartyi TaxID=61435 RepID=UPI0003C83C53|nr:16S rRNA (adenine(1518)-N(6)/adenine(1519)-N(6))-dimethyltransferase RsmA [Dehalococcoides mccartyi]AHB13112.1 dimethyladenosine transferase [Dehalococcoides mccartyi GY50]AII57552.1 16S rRNA methyltransferase [Dehalococcoides mccartyi CG1]APH12042.1 16S rRNA methyltransferase [Dehalococcoides mccartyi]
MEKDVPLLAAGVPSLMAQAKEMMEGYTLKARKGLGQHFLISQGVLNKILLAADLKPTDTVIEVGPGLGVLTEELLERAGQVIAVELDDKLVNALTEKFKAYPNFKIIHSDILKISPEEILGQNIPYKLVANLPYYITSAVLRQFLEAEIKPELMVVMVQKEVAKNMVAKTGDMGLLTLSVRFYGNPALVATVPAGAFYPPPEVDSAIVKVVIPQTTIMDGVSAVDFFKLARAGFGTRRKTLLNALAQGLGISKQDILLLLERSGIDSARRAETLSMEEWKGLCLEYTVNPC